MASALPWPGMGLFDNPQESTADKQQESQLPDEPSPTSATWGPTHSFDSDDHVSPWENACIGRLPQPPLASSESPLAQQPSSSPIVSSKKGIYISDGSGNTNPNQGGTPSSSASNSDGMHAPPETSARNAESLWDRATGFVSPSFRRNIDILQDYVGESCISTPCGNDTSGFSQPQQFPDQPYDDDIPVLGIARMSPPPTTTTASSIPGERSPSASSTSSNPIHQRRIQRHQDRQQPRATATGLVPSLFKSKKSKPPVSGAAAASATSPSLPRVPSHDKKAAPIKPSSSSAKKQLPPLRTLEVQCHQVNDLDRTISELTMRSSYGGYEASLAKLPDNRRMAYYAVGKHHRQSSRGGNRRCYFTAVGLPDKEALQKNRSSGNSRLGTNGGVITAVSPVARPTGAKSSLSVGNFSMDGGRSDPRATFSRNNRRNASANGGSSIASRTIGSKSMSKFSLDDLSLSIDGDLDPNWGLDRDFLLKVLPEANSELLVKMKTLYPEQFETLPVQVRDCQRWKLFIKFCFFSGLPIAEGEMHYRVQTDLAESTYGEEIVLSHDVMEAVNGAASAEILTLPNTKAFLYLRKHYNTQCSKLDERIFRRTSWERVAPEV